MNYDDENYERQMVSQVNNGQFANLIQIRLDTQMVIQRIEEFLSQKRVFLVKDKDGNITEEEKQIGTPLANSTGITGIMHIVHMRVNPHTIQGNYDEERYLYFMARTRKEITAQIIVNCYNWGIEDCKINLIIDTILGLIEPTLSRVIDNLERESYKNSLVSKEVVSNKSKNAFSGMFGGSI